MSDFALARAQLLHDHADKLFRDIHRELLDRLHQLAIHALGDDLGLADHQFEAFAAHHLDQDRKLQLAASHDDLNESVAVGLFHAQGNVGQQFFLQALAQIARSDVRAFASGEGRSVHREQHGDGGLVDGDVGQRRGIFGVGDGFADGDAFHAGDRDDVAQRGVGDVHALQAGE